MEIDHLIYFIIFPFNDNRIVISAVNSPVSVTLSGDPDEFLKFEKFIQNTSPSTFFAWLKLSSAYHSPFMDRIKDEFLNSCAHITPTHPPKNGYRLIFIFSSFILFSIIYSFDFLNIITFKLNFINSFIYLFTLNVIIIVLHLLLIMNFVFSFLE